MEYLVRFTPARPCSDAHCLEMTTQGIAERKEDASFVTYPYCPRHGYIGAVKQQQEPDERESIISFVLFANGGQGEVTDLQPAPLIELQQHGIKVRNDSPGWCDTAWIAHYQNETEHQAFYVLLSIDDTEFSIYPKRD